MGTIDQELNNYIWDNLNESMSIFSEKVYSILSRLREKEDRESFVDTLEAVVDVDNNLLVRLKELAYDAIDYIPIGDMTIEQLVKALDISPYDNYIDKIKYIDRALFFVKNHKKEAELYAFLLNNLAELYQKMGEYDKALPLHEKALKIREKLLGESHPNTADSYNNLANIYQYMGEYDKAFPLHKKALRIREEILGESHPDTASSYNNLANVYQDMGEYDKALPLHEKALKIREKLLGKSHPDTANSYHNLANVYQNMGEYEKALSLHEKSLRIREEVLGESHSDTTSSFNNLAIVYQDLKEYNKALFFHKKALKINVALLGRFHPDTARSYNNLAIVYQDLKKYNKALLLHKKVLKINEALLGESHPDTAKNYNNLANVYRKMEEYQKALPLHKKALKIREEILGESHPDTASSYNNLANLYESMEEYDKALSLYTKALKINEELLKITHPHTKMVHDNLNNIMNNINKFFFINSKFSKLNFKITKLKIQNFKQYHKPFEMDFSEKINIIIGQNAIGKTTLLQAITLGLLKEDSPDEETRYAKYITKDEQEAEIILFHNETKKVVTVKKEKREIDNNYFIPFVLAYGSNFFANYLESDEIVQKMLNEEVTENFAHSIFLEHTDGFWNPLSILRNLAISKHEKAQDKKDIFLDTLNIFLKEEGYEIVSNEDNENRFHFIKNEEKTRLTLSELSEGYRGNVLLITDMLIKILGVGWTPQTIEGIILIDEFDKHLHPKWQSNLVSKLADAFPKIQFIMTTHNPMSVLDLESNQITMIKEIDNKLVAVRGEGTKTIDISGVLLEYFGVGTVIGKSLEESLNRFTTLNIKNDLTQEETVELEALKEKLSKTVAVNFINDYRYFEYLKQKENNTPNTKDVYSAIDDLGDIL